MGQAFRRAAGTLRSSAIDTPSPPPVSSSEFQPPTSFVDRTRTPAAPVDRVDIYHNTSHSPQPEENASANTGNELEEKDPKFDNMLSQMVGRITAKPGGKQEIGEAFMVEKYNRALPKLRNTKTDGGRYEDRSVPAGTLNVAQLRHIMLLQTGKADDHDGPMDIKEIAQRFQVDVSQIQKILSFLSLPPEDNNTKQRHDGY
ncbi:hypothetical protein Dimus_001462 [Dionaea muscipula]